jgi:ornithine carbamoyltransferase
MWQRFTERGRRAVFFAQEEAAQLGENYIGTEHLLLGLIREHDCVAVRILDRMGIPLARIRSDIERQATRGHGNLAQDMQLTPRAKRVIDLAYEEARQLNNNYIGTEHLLLGLIREGDGLATRVLVKLGADLERARCEVHTMQEGDAPVGGAPEPSPGPVQSRAAESWWRHAPVARAREALRDVPDFLSIRDLSAAQLEALLALAQELKARRQGDRRAQMNLLDGKTLVMLFEKPSLRTRVTFETGMTQLGGHAIYLQPSDAQLGQRETVADAARNLERWVDGIMARTFRHETVVELARCASVPVINGLSDLEHPCQALADFLTIREKRGSVEGLKLAFVGDGNNVAHSLMLLGAKLGTHVVVACPEGYAPDAEITDDAEVCAAEAGGSITIVHDPYTGVKDADVIYTDVWASMGQEVEAEARAKLFAPFQVNAALLAAAAPDAVVMHCLPAHRGQEITDEVMDGPQSIVFDQAENRLHAQKAILAALL